MLISIMIVTFSFQGVQVTPVDTNIWINPLKAELNPICHLLALLGAHLIFHVSRIRVNSAQIVITIHCGTVYDWNWIQCNCPLLDWIALVSQVLYVTTLMTTLLSDLSKHLCNDWNTLFTAPCSPMQPLCCTMICRDYLASPHCAKFCILHTN